MMFRTKNVDFSFLYFEVVKSFDGGQLLSMDGGKVTSLRSEIAFKVSAVYSIPPRDQR